jgi:hypothetical protein
LESGWPGVRGPVEDGVEEDKDSVRSAESHRLSPRARRERGSAPALHFVAWNRAAELDDQPVVAVMLTDADADDV